MKDDDFVDDLNILKNPSIDSIVFRDEDISRIFPNVSSYSEEIQLKIIKDYETMRQFYIRLIEDVQLHGILE